MNSQLSATSRNQIRNHSGKLAGANIRNYPQPTGPRSATAGIYQLARRQPGVQFQESSDNHPINSENHPTDSKNPSISHRRIGSIHRSGCRNRSVESSDNRQVISDKRQIDSPVYRPNGLPNRKVIVNRSGVIVNFAAWNLSPIHHRNAEIYHPAGRPPAIRVLDLLDNRLTVAADPEACEENKG